MLRLRAARDVELVLLEEPLWDDVYSLIDANRAHLAPWMSWAPTVTRDSNRAFLADGLARFGRGEGFELGIRIGGRLVGGIGLHSVDARAARGALGFWVAADAQGRGVVTASARALTDHAFDALRLHRLEIRAAPANARSRRVAERLGYRFEGVLRECVRFRDEWADEAVYAMLDREWSRGGAGDPGR